MTPTVDILFIFSIQEGDQKFAFGSLRVASRNGHSAEGIKTMFEGMVKEGVTVEYSIEPSRFASKED